MECVCCSGIGIVNAIEVVTAFPEEDGLQKFRDWIESPDPAILGKFDVQTGLGARKKESKVGGSEAKCTGNGMEGTNPSGLNIPQAHEEKQSADHSQVIKQVFMDKHVSSYIISHFLVDTSAISMIEKIPNLNLYREMLARTGTFLLLFRVKQSFLRILVRKWTNQQSLSHGENQIFMLFTGKLSHLWFS